jgi:serine/threonine protein kinase
MNVGDTIRGYRILEPFRTTNAGFSRWTFACKGERNYFLKEFLEPKYPEDGAPGSAATKANKRKRCEAFEHHNRQLQRAIASKAGDGGNLIAPLDFFRCGTKYYKVTEKVDVSTLKPEHVALLTPDQRILLLLTVAHSLGVLHQLRIVHSDLKPDNILIKQKTDPRDSTKQVYIAKLIDFDGSYFAGHPLEEPVGDMVYYSPELAKYMKRDETVTPADLHTASDIFALGLIFCQYLTGRLPTFNSEKYNYPFNAINNGQMLRLTTSELPLMLIRLVDSMLDPTPSNRPSVNQVVTELREAKKGSLAAPAKVPGPRLVGPLLSRTKSDTPDSVPSERRSGANQVSRLVGKLRRQTKSDTPESDGSDSTGR